MNRELTDQASLRGRDVCFLCLHSVCDYAIIKVVSVKKYSRKFSSSSDIIRHGIRTGINFPRVLSLRNEKRKEVIWSLRQL